MTSRASLSRGSFFFMTTMPSIQTIIAALQGGRPAEAERLCRERLAAQPQDQDALFSLAMSQQFQGKLEEAAESHRCLTELFPESGVHWGNYAATLHALGRLDEAQAAYAAAVRLDPRNPDPRINLGLLLIQRQDYRAAREMLLDAFEIDQNLPQARIHAARACCHCQDFHGAEDLLKPWRSWLPLRDDALQMELSRLLLLLADADGARGLLEDIVRRNPAHLEAKVQLAKVDERLNRLAEAEALLGSIAQGGLPEEARREVAHVRAILAMRKGDAATARSLLEQSGPMHDKDFGHYYELAKVYDKLGDTEQALRALRSAHALQVEELKLSSPRKFEPGALPLPAATLHVSAEDYRRWPELLAPDSRSSPVFIVGFPRSGTTLLEQMLDAHPALQSMDENPFFDRLADTLRRHDERILDDLSVLRQLDCDELRKRYLVMACEKVPRRWDAQLVDKNPFNMLWLPMIYRLFPKAKFIVALRHPCDVVLSCYMQNFRSSILGAASETLERLAAAYVQAMRGWLHHVDVFKPQVLLSRYEDLVADFPQQTRRIADFLELEDASPMMKFDQRAREKGYIATPSYTQVIEPVNTKGVNRWLRYHREFERVLPILEPMLEHWGYPTAASN